MIQVNSSPGQNQIAGNIAVTPSVSAPGASNPESWPVSTATPNAERNVYMVSVSSSAKYVRIYFDPALRERNEQTASLNKAVELGYEPPVSSTQQSEPGKTINPKRG